MYVCLSSELQLDLSVHLALVWFENGVHFFREESGNLEESDEKERERDICVTVLRVCLIVCACTHVSLCVCVCLCVYECVRE